MPFPILDSSWHPFALCDEISRAITDQIDGGRLVDLVELGSNSAVGDGTLFELHRV